MWKLSETKEGLSKLSEAFLLCEDLKEKDDTWDLLYWIMVKEWWW